MPTDWTNEQFIRAQRLVESGELDGDSRRDTILRGIQQFKESQYGPPEDTAALGTLPETDTDKAYAARAEQQARIDDQQLAQKAALYDHSLPTASKRKDLAAPTEFHPPDASGGLMGPLVDLYHRLPSTVGGGTEMYKEPSLAEFRKTSGSREGMSSDAYKEFADKRWQQRLAAAQASGTPVVRTDFIQPESALGFAGKKAAQLANDAPGALDAAIVGAGDTATLGLATRVLPAAIDKATGSQEELTNESLREEFPVASGLGSIVGGARGLAGKLLGEAPGALRVGGAAAGARLGENLSHGAADAIAGRDTPTLTAAGLLEQPLLAGAVGAGIGKVGAAAGQTQKNLRSEALNPELGPAIRELEAAGGGISANPLGQTARYPKSIAENFDVGSPGYAVDRAAAKVAPKVAAKAVERLAATEGAFDGAVQGYLETSAGRTKVPPVEFARGLRDAVRARQYQGTGDTLPLGHPEEYKRALAASHEVSEPFVPGTPRDTVDGSEIMSVAEARGLGLPVKGADQMNVQVKVRPMNAAEFEQMMGDLRLVAKEGSQTKIPPETYRRLAAQAREDRDKFPWPKELGEEPTAVLPEPLKDGRSKVKGWSAVHQQYHQELDRIERQLQDMGILRTKDTPVDVIESGVGASARRYGQPGGGENDRALTELAQLPGGSVADILRGLREIPGTRAVPKVNSAGRMVRPGMSLGAGALSGMRVSLDPLAGLISDTAPSLGVAAGAGSLDAVGRKVTQGAKKRGARAILTTKEMLNEEALKRAAEDTP